MKHLNLNVFIYFIVDPNLIKTVTDASGVVVPLLATDLAQNFRPMGKPVLSTNDLWEDWRNPTFKHQPNYVNYNINNNLEWIRRTQLDTTSCSYWS